MKKNIDFYWDIETKIEDLEQRDKDRVFIFSCIGYCI